VEADVYVWCYALLVVHARTEEEEEEESFTAQMPLMMATSAFRLGRRC